MKRYDFYYISSKALTNNDKMIEKALESYRNKFDNIIDYYKPEEEYIKKLRKQYPDLRLKMINEGLELVSVAACSYPGHGVIYGFKREIPEGEEVKTEIFNF